jgi:flagellar hook-associated protein 3 FlgL
VQADRAVAALRQSVARQAALQQSISSGVRLQRPSDGPSDYVAAHETLALNQRLGTYLNTAGEATSDLNVSVSALLEGGQLLNQAADLASQGINGATDPTSFDALASQVDNVIDRMLALGNSQAGGRYLYGGTATQQPPFAITARGSDGRPTAISYQGSGERAQVLIGPGQTVDTRYAGDQVFQSAGGDVFQALIGLRDALRNSSLDPTARTQALTQQFTQIQNAHTAVLQTVGEQSASLESLDAVQNRIQDVQLDLQKRAGDLQGTDYADAVVRLQEEQTTYQATLATTAKIFSASLLNFLS